jgi:16S rRNA (guanine966-N2)-methyltransferase
VRPTSDRARQAYFNIVRDRLDGGRFLDLYAGTGIFSVEALSRGAEHAVAIDESKRGAAALTELARALEIRLDVRCAKLPQSLRSIAAEPAFDLVYADPPYDLELDIATLAAIDESVPLAGGAIVAVEHRAGPTGLDRAPLTRLRFVRIARYGNVAIALFDLPDA